ncbi:SIMPL domain-containing protein [Sphingomonas sp. CA1-15]|uniref:SIMPL domain-containing protein n=2 Tax=Sphingomonas immobilis TaxID=3063997 RepID=A0ABT8ZZU5_9SPHN|nr:SIMPL domain-containing protein [Sphingomonas sp. CA1-15]MDO7843105.1 SIMPL domain-containing protein [Sphingomonas sp. CA1-15]
MAVNAQSMPSPILPDGTILDVSAEGRTTRVPDVATIRAGVVTQGATAAAALADNAARMTKVFASLKKAGIAERDIRTANVSLSPQYRYADGQAPAVTGYQASNSVSVRFRDIAKSGAILDALVGVGANQIDGPNLALDQPDAALDEARADAVKKARARAELYAKAAGLSVSRIVSIAESGSNDGGSPQPPVMYMRAKAADSTPVAAGETDVTVTLSVRFLLK